MSTSRSHKFAFASLAAILIFFMGWWAGRHREQPPATTPTSNATVSSLPPSTSSPPTTAGTGVQLVIDAGAIRLLPDASLSLDPIEPPPYLPAAPTPSSGPIP